MNLLLTRYRRTILVAISLFTFIPQLLLSQSSGASTNGYGNASYSVGDKGKFMRVWLVSGPIPVSDNSTAPAMDLQEKIFKTDLISSVNVVATKPAPALNSNQQQLNWQLITSTTDIVDFDHVYKNKDYVYAYALAEIKSAAAESCVLALGSDDGVKVWHNGKLVHDNWIPRSTNKDEDLVTLNLVKGSNQLLFKVQDMSGGWAFVARLLDKPALTNQLNAAAGSGNIDKIKLLIDGGADINAASENGITPVAAAKVSGRAGVVEMLIKNGAKDVAVPASEKLVDNFYQPLKEKLSPGIAVLVARDGQILYEKGFGFADIKNNVKVTPDTKFRIGSVTKQFTSAAILKLQEKGMLSVNDKLSKFIPDYPRGDEVSIHHLLTHTSGIHSYTSKPDFIDKVTKTITPDELISSFKNDSFDFNPGDKMLYNNSGYFLLGYIVSKVSGKPLDEYLKENFFVPLQMNNTGIHHAGIKLANEAKGYANNGGSYSETINWDMSWAGAAGALYSTLEDLWKWNQGLYSGKVLSKSSLDAALTPAILNNAAEPSMRYGYGLAVGKYRGVEIVNHGGGLHGFVTQLAYYPQEKLTVVMFSNTDEPSVNFDHNKIAEAFLWQKMEKQDAFVESSVKPTNLQQYTGRFEMLNVGVLTITTENDKLFAQLSGQAKFEIFPMAPDEFYWKVVAAKLKFVKDEKGEINGAILFQNGQELKAKKLAEETIVTVSPAILDTYIGKYRLTANNIVTISKENNALFAQPTDDAKFPMLPISDSEFVIKEINARLTFVKDANGKANKIKLVMNGAITEMPRIE